MRKLLHIADTTLPTHTHMTRRGPQAHTNFKKALPFFGNVFRVTLPP